MQVTIVKSNSTVRRSTLMPTLTGHHLLSSNERSSMSLGLGIKPSDCPTRLRSMGQDGQLITTPPQLNSIGIKTQSFQRIVEPFIWNYLVENNEDGDDDNDDNDISDDDDKKNNGRDGDVACLSSKKCKY